MMDSQLAKQRREELLREVELNRLAKRGAGDSQAARWPESGSGMGDQEASRTLPQASEDLEECWRLGTQEVFLCAKEALFGSRTHYRTPPPS
jgi:hypothetical protein